jgi:hypothetical protein
MLVDGASLPARWKVVRRVPALARKGILALPGRVICMTPTCLYKLYFATDKAAPVGYG